MKTTLVVLTLFMLVIGIFNPTLAQDNSEVLTVKELMEMSLEELLQVKIVTIATGTKQSLLKAPAVATVITAEDIEATGATEVEDVLEMVPGLHVSKYFIGYEPIYIIRGIYLTYNPQVLMLVNGIPITRLYLGNRGVVWSGMPVKNIARIEVIRGPGSAVYGAEAFAGVINIVTKTPEEIKGTEAGVRMGSFNTRDAWLLHGGKWGGVEIAAALESHDTAGPHSIIEKDSQTTFDALYGTHASLAPGAISTPKRGLDARLDLSRGVWQLRLGYQQRRNVGVGAGLSQALDSSGRFTEDRINTDLTYHDPEFTKNWDVTAQLSVFNTAFDSSSNLLFFPPGAFGGAYPEGYIGNHGISERQTRLTLSGFYKGIEKHLLRVGTGFSYADLYKVKQVSNFGINPATGQPLPPGSGVMDMSDTPWTFIPETARKNWHLFVQDVYTFASDWELTAGLRYDHYSDFGNTLNPRLALVWQTHPQLTTKLLYGRAFRAPSFYELYAINNPVTLGNPNLKAETIDTLELAFNYHPTKNFQLSANLFAYEMNDMIGYPLGSEAFIRAANAGSQKGRGMELETQWQVNRDLKVTGNYAFQLPKTAYKDRYGPQHHVYLRGDWSFLPHWSLDVQSNWVLDRGRSVYDPRSAIDDYTIVDLTLRYKPAQAHWNLGLSVRNLFDTDAREPSPPGSKPNDIVPIPGDLPLAGRSGWVELGYRF